MLPKIKIFGLIFFLILSITSFAKKVTIKKAIQLAKNLIIEKTSLTLPDQSLSYSISNTYTFSENSHNLAYLFNLSPTGFVIVSADDRCYPVIGYSFENCWKQDDLAPALTGWMNGYKEEILQAINENIPYKTDIISQTIKVTWDYYLREPFIAEAKAQKNINPLLSSTWNQGRYYNEMCPSDTNGHGGHAYTGCVATAMAQVLFYFRYPESGEGSMSYETSKYGIIEADFEHTTYHWNRMLNTIYYENNQAMAEMIFHCGVSVETTYGPNGSGAETIDVADALINHFKYSANLQYLVRDSTENWRALLQSNLDNNIPVIYRGRQGWGGHAFVCDGYQGDDFYHFNWGWGGAFNGYFYINNLNPAGYDFNDRQAAIFNIYPRENYPLFLNFIDTLTSHCGTIEDGSGPLNYTANTLNTWLIAPQDPEIINIQLRFDRLETEPGQDVIRVYDGMDRNAPVIGVFSGSSIPEVLTSSSNSLLIEFETNQDINDAGWMATWYGYKEPFCQNKTILTGISGSFSDHSGPYDYVNSCECNWLIAPHDEEHDSISNIILKIVNLNTEPDYDILYIYDGYDDTFPLLGTFSGNETGDEICSSGDKIFIKFTTDNKNTGAGWQINYVSQFPNYCSETTFLPPFLQSFGDGSGHRKYNNNTQCSWHIKAEMPCNITLFFTKFEVEHNYDLLTILDPLTNPPTILAQYSGFIIPPPITSTNGEMLITFTTDDAIIFDGWEAEYSISGLGIGNHDQDKVINIYPNPAHQFISLGFKLMGIGRTERGGRIEIFDLFGREVEEIVVPPWQETVRMDVSGWNAGVYVAVLWGEDGVIGREKFVVTR